MPFCKGKTNIKCIWFTEEKLEELAKGSTYKKNKPTIYKMTFDILCMNSYQHVLAKEVCTQYA
jgi:hypothetical protein